MNISYEAVGIARAVTSGWMNPERDAAYRDAQKAAQLAINSATATLQKEIERLRGEVEKAVEVLTEIAQEHHTTFREIGDIGYSDGLYLKPDLFKKVKSVLDNSRAKRVAEGKE